MKNNNKFYYVYELSKNIFIFIFLFFIMNLQTSLSLFSIFKTSTPSLISIVLYLGITRLNIKPSNLILFSIGFLHDIIIGNNLGITSIFLLLLKFFTEIIILNKINNKNQEEWIYFTIIFIFAFSIIFLLNLLINLSIPQLSPIFFHVGITLILFPVLNFGINIFSFVTRLIKS